MSSQEHIIQAIQNYLDCDHPNAALLINGEWGSGKTYFWKKTIVPMLEDKSRHHVYVSLYGVSSHSEIEQQVLYGIFPFLDSKIFRLGRFIGEIRGYRVPPIKYVPKLHRAVFCFDDLERSSLKVSDALGYINRFIEQYGSHVLVLANELQIADEKYVTVKEKVVGKTFAMKPDIELALTNIWEALSNRAKFLDDHRQSIQKTIASCEPINLRSAIQAVDNCNLVLHRLEKFPDLDPDVVDSIVKMTSALTMESKINPQLLEHLQGFFVDTQAFMFATYSRRNEGDEKGMVEILEGFATRYFDKSLDDIPTLTSIVHFLESGWIDADKLHGEAVALSLKDEPERNDPRDVFLHDIWSMTDEQVIDIAQSYIRDVDADLITSAELLARVFATLVFISKHRVIDPTPAKLLEKFVKAVSRLSEEGKFSKRNIGGWDANAVFYGPVDEEVLKLFEALNAARDRFNEREHQERLRSLFNEFDQDYETFLRRMTGKFEEDHFDYCHRAVLAKLDTRVFANQLMSKDAKDIQHFSQLLSQRYFRVSNIADFLEEEADVLVDLAKQLSDGLSSIGAGMKRVAIGRVMEQLNNAAIKLNPEIEQSVRKLPAAAVDMPK